MISILLHYLYIPKFSILSMNLRKDITVFVLVLIIAALSFITLPDKTLDNVGTSTEDQFMSEDYNITFYLSAVRIWSEEDLAFGNLSVSFIFRIDGNDRDYDQVSFSLVTCSATHSNGTWTEGEISEYYTVDTFSHTYTLIITNGPQWHCWSNFILLAELVSNIDSTKLYQINEQLDVKCWS